MGDALAQSVLQALGSFLQLLLEGFHLLGNSREFLLRDHPCLRNLVSGAVRFPMAAPIFTAACSSLLVFAIARPPGNGKP